jgi:hypothetical protein
MKFSLRTFLLVSTLLGIASWRAWLWWNPPRYLYHECTLESAEAVLQIDLDFGGMHTSSWDFPLRLLPGEHANAGGLVGGGGIPTGRAHGATDSGDPFVASSTLYIDDTVARGVEVEVSGYLMVGKTEDADFDTRVVIPYRRNYQKQLTDNVWLRAWFVSPRDYKPRGYVE